jgi:hypothetical protein
MRKRLDLGKQFRDPDSELNLTSEERSEIRYALYVVQEERYEYANPQPMTLEEVPRSGSHSGWMRTQEEANILWKTMLQPK